MLLHGFCTMGVRGGVVVRVVVVGVVVRGTGAGEGRMRATPFMRKPMK